MGSQLVRDFLNFIGGFIRFLYGTIWRTIFKKDKFTFKEYLYGPNNSDYYDDIGHRFNNSIIGVLVFVFIIVPLIRLIFG